VENKALEQPIYREAMKEGPENQGALMRAGGGRKGGGRPQAPGPAKEGGSTVGTMDRGPRPMDRTGPDGPGGRTGGRTSGRTGLTVQAHEAQ